MGFEEALGYSIGEVVRDKDGISATLLLLDLASNLKARNQTLWDARSLGPKVWRPQERAAGHQARGSAGAEAITGAMQSLRTTPPTEIASDVVLLRDLQSRVALDCKTGASWPVPLPPSNVLEFTLACGTRVLARPSGTEPKIKFLRGGCCQR